MPKEQFFKLKNEKSKKIMLAARAEFSEKSYDEVSINDIVHRSNISRGSFYLYFEDKWDIYSHLLRCTFDQIIDRMKDTLMRGNNIFFAMIDIYDYVIMESNLDESLGFITNILKNVNPIIYSKVYEVLSVNENKKFIEEYCFKKEDFTINANIEFEMLKKLLITNLINAMVRVLVHHQNPEEAREELRISYNILKYGTYK